MGVPVESAAALRDRAAGRRPGWAAAVAVLPLVLILALAAGLRVHDIGLHPAQFDEPLSLELTRGLGYQHEHLAGGVLWRREAAPDILSLHGAGGNVAGSMAGVWLNAHHDSHPPLYFMVLRAWREAFGDGIAAARALSVVCALLAIALAYLACRREYGVAVAVWAGLLMAVAPSLISVSQDARNYAMAMMFVCLAWYGEARRSAWMVFAGALGGVFTHYSCVFPLAVMAVWWRRNWRAYLLAAGVFAAAWGPYVPEQVEVTSRTKFYTYIPCSTMQTLAAIAATPARWFVSDGGNWVIGLLLPLVCLRRRTAWLAAAAVATIAPVALWDLRAHSMEIANVRYTVVAAPLACALVAGRRVWLIPAALGIFCLVWLPKAYEGRSPDFNWLTRYADARSDAHTAVVFAVTPQIGGDDPAGFFYTFTCGAVKRAGWIMIADGPVPPRRFNDGVHSVWVVSGWGGRAALGPLAGFKKVDGMNFPEGAGTAEKWVRQERAEAGGRRSGAPENREGR